MRSGPRAIRLALVPLLVSAALALVSPAAALASAPSIESASATNLRPTDATLEFQINSGGLPTNWRVYLEAPSCQSVNPPGFCEASGGKEIWNGGFSTDSSDETVTVDIAKVWRALSPQTSYAYRIVASNEAGEAIGVEKEFETPAGPAPSIEETSVTNISAHDATLNLQIDPHGLPTSYEVMLTTPNCPGPPAAGGCQSISVWFLQGEVPVAFGDQSVSIDFANRIWPSHPYNYKVWATNSEGTAEAFGQFTTPAALPAIDAESASGVTEHDATLEAQINPQSLQRGALYQFQVVKDPSEYLPSFACPTEGFPSHTSLCLGLPAQAGALRFRVTPAAEEDQSVSLDLTSAGMTLQPDTTYHYRVIAARSILEEDTTAWEEPIVYGPDLTFTTSSEPGAQPLTQPGDTDPQAATTRQSSSPASSSHRKKHRHHRRARPHLAKRAAL